MVVTALLPLVCGLALGAVALEADPSVSPAVAVEAPAVYPLKDIKPGQVAQGHTVFSSLRGPDLR